MKKDVFYNGVELVSIAKNTGLGIFGKLFFLVVRFCIAVLITRTLGPEQYGIYLLAMSIVVVAATLGAVGLEPTMVKFVAEYKAQKDISRVRSVVGFGLMVTMISSLILSIGVFLSADSVARVFFHEAELASVLRVVILSVPFTCCLLVAFSALQGAKLVKYRILLEQLVMPPLRFVVIAVTFFLGFRLMGVAWAWVITTVVGFIAAGILMMKKTGLSLGTTVRAEKKKILSFSIPLLLSKLINQNNRNMGVILIGILMPAAQVGIFGVGLRAMPFILMPLVAYNAIFSPIISGHFAKGRMEDLASIYKTGSRWVISLTLPLFVLLTFFSREVVSIFGSGFAESGKIMIILLMGSMISAAAGSSGAIITMTGKSLYTLFNSVLLLIFNMILIIILVRKFGTIGAAYAYSTSIILVQILQMGQVWHLYKIHPYSSQHVKPILSCLFAFAVIYVLKNVIGMSNLIASTVVLAATFLTCYMGILLFIGLTDEDRMVLGKLRQRILG